MSSTYPPYGGTPTQFCQRCGLALPPNTTLCGNCGYQGMPAQGASPAAQPQNPSNVFWGGGAMPQAASGQTQLGGQSWPQTLGGSPPAPVQSPSSPQNGYPSSTQNTTGSRLSAFAPNPQSLNGQPSQPSQPSNKLSSFAPNPQSLNGQPSQPSQAPQTSNKLSAFAPNGLSLSGQAPQGPQTSSKLSAFAPNGLSLSGQPSQPFQQFQASQPSNKLSAFANNPATGQPSQPSQPSNKLSSFASMNPNVPVATPQTPPAQALPPQGLLSGSGQGPLFSPGTGSIVGQLPQSLQSAPPAQPNNYFSTPAHAAENTVTPFAGMGNYNAPGVFPTTGDAFRMSGSQPAFPGTPGAPGSPNGYQSGAFPAPQANGAGFTAEPEKRKASGVGTTIGVLVLLVILIGGGFFGYTYVTHTTIIRPPTAVATPLPTLKGTPIFTDTFQNNSNGWDLQSKSGSYAVTLGNGTLALEDNSNKLLPVFVPGGKTFNNFTLRVDAVLSKGDQSNGYGIFIRSASDKNDALATYYRFELYGDGSYAVFKGNVDKTGKSSATKLVDYTQHAALQPQGGVNHIMLTADGSTLTFVVNGYTLKTLSDSSYMSGLTALFVSNAPGAHAGAQVQFSNFTISQPQ